jgi:hypothetical protein
VISDKTDILCGDIQEVDLVNLYFHSHSGKLMVIFSTDNKIGDRQQGSDVLIIKPN